MITIDHDVLYGDGIDFVQTPNVGGVLLDCRFIIIHFTGGFSRESSVKHLCNPTTKASAHLVIGRDGRISQLAKFNQITYHAGVSEWKGLKGINKVSIGIELDCAGKLDHSGQSWFGRSYPSEETVTVDGVKWHRYTEPQLLQTLRICKELVQKYKTITDILGHRDIAPNRKVDPGPHFPIDRFRRELFDSSRDRDEDLVINKNGVMAGSQNGSYRVTVESLNLRKAPILGGEQVIYHLPLGAVVKEIGRIPGWCNITTEVQGWVSEMYLKAIKMDS